MTDTSREAAERELIDYLDAEAEHEIECAQEMTDLAKELRKHETTARRLVRERDALEAKIECQEQSMADQEGELSLFHEKNIRLQAKLAEAAETLAWYRANVSWCNNFGPEGTEARDRLAKDIGGRAEAAINKIGEQDDQ